MLPWLCLGRSCGAFERSDFRGRKKTGHPAHSKNSKAWPLGKPFPWILSRVKTIPTWTQRHAWMLPWLCFDCSCGAFERSEFRRPGVIITHRTCNYCLFVPFLPFSGFLVFSLSPFLLFPFSFFLLLVGSDWICGRATQPNCLTLRKAIFGIVSNDKTLFIGLCVST